MTIRQTLCALGLATLTLWACNETPKGEQCANASMPACIPPVDDKASAELKKLHTDIASRWSLAKITTIDTVHKNAPMGDYRKIKAELCLATNGGVQYFINRDWKLNPTLFSACRKEAKELCYAREEWNPKDATDEENRQYGCQSLLQRVGKKRSRDGIGRFTDHREPRFFHHPDGHLSSFNG